MDPPVEKLFASGCRPRDQAPYPPRYRSTIHVNDTAARTPLTVSARQSRLRPSWLMTKPSAATKRPFSQHHVARLEGLDQLESRRSPEPGSSSSTRRAMSSAVSRRQRCAPSTPSSRRSAANSPSIRSNSAVVTASQGRFVRVSSLPALRPPMALQRQERSVRAVLNRTQEIRLLLRPLRPIRLVGVDVLVVNRPCHRAGRRKIENVGRPGRQAGARGQKPCPDDENCKKTLHMISLCT